MNHFLKKYKNSYFSYFLMYNFYYLSWTLFSALISVYLLDKGFKASDVSFVVSASYLTSMVAQPVIGAWNDRFDIKKVDALLFAGACIGGIVFMTADSLVMIAVSYSFVLMLLNGTNPVMEKLFCVSRDFWGQSPGTGRMPAQAGKR